MNFRSPSRSKLFGYRCNLALFLSEEYLIIFDLLFYLDLRTPIDCKLEILVIEHRKRRLENMD
jgi:hypothetical protein